MTVAVAPYPFAAQGGAEAEVAQVIATALAEAGAALAAVRPLAVSLADIRLPDLPDPPLGALEDAAALKSVAPLYLAMELEATGLTAAGSAAAGLFASGALRLGEGPAAEALMRFHRGYERRLPRADRNAAYLRLFGSAPDGAAPFAVQDAVNTGFEEHLLALAEAMHKFAHSSPQALAPAVARREVARAGLALGRNLIPRAGGVTPYIAEETLAVIHDVVTLFQHRALQEALGARLFWDAVATALALAAGHGRRGAEALGPVALARLSRGRAGLKLITWLGENAAALARGGATLDLRPDAPVLAEGTAWLQATLSLLSQADGQGHD